MLMLFHFERVVVTWFWFYKYVGELPLEELLKLYGQQPLTDGDNKMDSEDAQSDIGKRFIGYWGTEPALVSGVQHRFSILWKIT